MVGYSAAGQCQHGPLPQAASSLAHEGLVLPLVGKQAQEHGILPLIEAGAHAEHDANQQTAVMQIILNIIGFLRLISLNCVNRKNNGFYHSLLRPFSSIDMICFRINGTDWLI